MIRPNQELTKATKHADAATVKLSPLPFASHPLPGIGGTIKAVPEHFVVEEKLPYEALGEGEHIYVTFRRTGWNTADAARAIQKRLDLSPCDVGWGGRKDKTAVAIQTFSLRCGVKHPLKAVEKAFGDLPFEIIAINRHRNKIKTGHVAANRFTIILSRPEPDALSRALAIANQLRKTGVPNFYGPPTIRPPYAEHSPGIFSLLFKEKSEKRRFHDFGGPVGPVQYLAEAAY